jgi:hypothetical protein
MTQPGKTQTASSRELLYKGSIFFGRYKRKEHQMHAFLANQILAFLPIPIPNFGAVVRRRRLELSMNAARAAAFRWNHKI